MNPNWIIHLETEEFAEFHEAEFGRVEHTLSGWDAYVYIPDRLRAGHIVKHKVGECYPSAVSAKTAVKRAYLKYSPLIVKS